MRAERVTERLLQLRRGPVVNALAALAPARLAVGHRPVVESPAAAMAAAATPGGR